MGVLMQDMAGHVIILMCKLTADRADGGGGYLGFAHTSWYGTSDIQISQTKRTSTRRATLVFEVPNRG